MLAFAIIAGYMHRRPVAILLFISIAAVVIHCLKNKNWWENQRRAWLSVILYFCLFSLIGLALYPWIHISNKVRPYHFHSNNFFNFSYLTAYLKILPEVLSYPIAVLCFLGFIVCIVKRSVVGAVACGFFIFLYVLFTGDDPIWLPVTRFVVLFIPSISILVAVSLGAFSGKRAKSAVLSGVVMISIVSLLIWNSDSPAFGIYPADTERLSSMPYYPSGDLVTSLKKRRIKHGNVIYPVYWQTASAVYYAIYGVGGYMDRVPAWKPMGSRDTTMPEVKKFCDMHNCVALVVPLKKRGNGEVELVRIVDATYEQLEDNRLKNFHVEKIIFYNKRGLALLLPK